MYHHSPLNIRDSMETHPNRESEENSCLTGEAAHVLIFPCPAQGHVNPMLKLAELLALHNLHVTFVNTESIHNRLIRFNDIEALSVSYPKLKFKTIPDFNRKEYVDDKHPPGIGERVVNLIVCMDLYAKLHLRDVLVSAGGVPKISCIIADGLFGNLTTDLAAEFGILNIYFRTLSACCFWAHLCAPKLFQSNQLPIRGEEDMDRIITNIPGMENLLRCRDLPSFYRENANEHIAMDTMILKSKQTLEADAIIINTFEDLEGPVLSQFRLQFPKLYTVGPLHHHLNMKKAAATTKPSFKSSFFELDESCMTWLDAQPKRSVIYVSFGSITSLKREEIMEIWHGLVKSKQKFLWVMRPDMVLGKDDDDDSENKMSLELEEGSKERGFIVGWAPQEEVLAHKAIGGFLTHSGWNSTLEAVVAGVPMICWPYFADQQINSRFVSEVWKLGLDMKDVCERKVVENMVNDVMVHRKEEFLKSAQEMAELAHKSVSPGGSSYTCLDELIKFIKSSI